MSRLIYLGYGHFVTNDRVVNNQLQTQLSGKLGNRPKHIEEPLVQPEMFPVANADQVSHGDGGVLVAPEMTWDELKPNYSGQATPNQQEEPLVAPVMTWD